ncbi:MAG: RagB/SusD family nutrient uptake outer membrane protein [Williamsia sp.]|nr:RagB/SusD family nutrient uptake outer membrane protein [Williamsia sp.]
MKKTLHFLIPLTLLLCMQSACKKNVDDGVIHQTGEITQPQLVQNPSFVKGFLDNTYNFLQVRYDLDSNGAMLAAASDEAVNSNVNSPVYTLVNGTWGPSRTFDDSYSNYYSGIRKANLFLSSISKGEIVPVNAVLTVDSLRKRWRGEAFFLRAFFHFELVKRYGSVVLATKVFDRDEDLNLPRNSFDECVNQIAADCDSAIVGLPLWNTDYSGSSDTKEIGRATKIAAMSLKARLFLYAASPLYNTGNDLAKWQKAADAAKAVIDLNRAQLITPYANIFNYSTAAYNNEVIFATQAVNTNAIEINNAPISYNGALGRTNPTQELVDAFEMSNGKPISDPTSGYNANNPYASRDPRLALTILYNGAIFKSVAVQTFTGGKDGIGQTINATQTGYYMKKFLSENATWNQTTNASVRRPWVWIRYADILLMYAEALNEAQGPVADVAAKVNLVRTRAGMPNLPTGLTQAQMRDRIHNERRVELCFEDHRFFDVRRWKEGESFFNKTVTGMRITANAAGQPTAYERFPVQAKVFQAKNYWYPFPQTEMDVTPKLKQNPGY